jgi:hypothetical protein
LAGKTKQMGKLPRTRHANDGGLSTAHDEHSDSPSAAQAFAAKAKDLGALREAVVDAAGVGTGLWLSYLFLFFYLFMAVAAVTHRDLLFENPVRLPFLNVELPLLGFFVLGPLLFLVLYAYVLLHVAMLAGKVGVFDAELRVQIRDDDTRARLRRQLPSNIFVQYLAGPYEVRTGIMGFMLRLIAVISLVAFPIALLVFFQLQFLPYHHAPIAWWQRIAVLLGILLLWMFWPSIARGQAKWISWHDLQRWKIRTLLLASLVPLLLVFTIATFPGEWLNRNLPSLRLVPTKWPELNSKYGVDVIVRSMEWTSLHDLLVAGDVDLLACKPTSLWSNRLVLPGIDVIDHAKFNSEEKIAVLRETLSLRGRRLEGAVLIGSGLRKVDLTGARLTVANLESADLRDAKISCAERERDCAQLQGAYLDNAHLQGADLREAELQGASLAGADLLGAQLRWVKFQNTKQGAASGSRFASCAIRARQFDGCQLDGRGFEGRKSSGRKFGRRPVSRRGLAGGCNLGGQFSR